MIFTRIFFTLIILINLYFILSYVWEGKWLIAAASIIGPAVFVGLFVGVIKLDIWMEDRKKAHDKS